MEAHSTTHDRAMPPSCELLSHEFPSNNGTYRLRFDNTGVLVLIVQPEDLMHEMRKRVRRIRNYESYVSNM